jgi:hypothetical protein
VINLETDPNNCGMCGNICPQAPHATPTCDADHCGIACNTGFRNCDGVLANGCATDVETDASNCGACGNVCMLANAASTCTNGNCAITVCTPPYRDCNGMAADGCEVDIETDPQHCGSCANACTLANATPKCTGRVCAIASCTMGFADCDRMAADGCEVDIETDPGNCGSCGNACMLANAVPGCAMGHCTVASCNPGFGDCNGDPTDGCEADFSSDMQNCGMCENPCLGGTICIGGFCVF